jgi:alpha-L-fucosidase 2
MTDKFKYKISFTIAYLLLSWILPSSLWSQDIAERIDKKEFDPATLMWYTAPADKWENALPVGNGRLGGMVFGGVDEERI